MKKEELFNEFYKNKNYDYLKSELASSNEFLDKIFLAKVYLKLNDIRNAALIYKETGQLYEYGRCLLLEGKFEKTKALWLSLEPDSPPVLWGRSLLEFIEMYVIHLPAFFQIRSFLEMDLDALLKAGQIKFAENIINGADLFAKANSESYKFIARVLVNNNYHSLAGVFLEKAKNVCYVASYFIEVYTEIFKDSCCNTFTLSYQSEEQVFRTYIVMTELSCLIP